MTGGKTGPGIGSSLLCFIVYLHFVQRIAKRLGISTGSPETKKDGQQ